MFEIIKKYDKRPLGEEYLAAVELKINDKSVLVEDGFDCETFSEVEAKTNNVVDIFTKIANHLGHMIVETKSQDFEKKEFVKCAKSFHYFCETYLTLTTYENVIEPTKKIVPFKLFDFQKNLIREMEDNRFLAVVKFRQGGFSSTVLAWLLWNSIFKLDQRIMYQSKTDREARYSNQIVQRFINGLPTYLKPSATMNDYEIRFKETNGNMFFGVPQAACSRAVSYLYIDEAAFIPDMENHWKAMHPVLHTGGRCIVVSTPNGKNNWFHNVVSKATTEHERKLIESGNNLDEFDKSCFALFKPHYREYPEYNDPEWVVRMIKNLGVRGFTQEVECNFI